LSTDCRRREVFVLFVVVFEQGASISLFGTVGFSWMAAYSRHRAPDPADCPTAAFGFIHHAFDIAGFFTAGRCAVVEVVWRGIERRLRFVAFSVEAL